MLIGLAAAIKLTPLVFLLFFLLRKDYRAITVSVLSFFAVTAIGFLGAPRDSVTYWTRSLFRTTEVVGTNFGTNQSLFGLFARFGMDDHARTVAWLLGSVVVLAITIPVMRWALAAGHDVIAVVVNGVAGLLASPISWSHHWVWIVPALVVLVSVRSWRLWLVAAPVVVIFAVASALAGALERRQGTALVGWRASAWKRVCDHRVAGPGRCLLGRGTPTATGA